jgi:hypothetical protein
MTRDELLAAIGEPDHSVLLGFSYTSKAQPTLAYVKAAAVTASRLPPGRTLVIVVKDFPELDRVPLPPNVRLRRLVEPSLALSESAVAHSDEPVMITGDVSLSFALQYEKLYFYEMRRHKAEAIKQLGLRLTQENPMLENDGWKEATTTNPWQDPDRASGILAPLLHDEDLFRAFRSAVAAVREHVSLPLSVRRLLQSLNVAV